MNIIFFVLRKAKCTQFDVEVRVSLALFYLFFFVLCLYHSQLRWIMGCHNLFNVAHFLRFFFLLPFQCKFEFLFCFFLDYVRHNFESLIFFLRQHYASYFVNRKIILKTFLWKTDNCMTVYIKISLSKRFECFIGSACNQIRNNKMQWINTFWAYQIFWFREILFNNIWGSFFCDTIYLKYFLAPY